MASQVKCIEIIFADDDILRVATSRNNITFDGLTFAGSQNGITGIADYAETLELKNSPLEMTFVLDDAMIARIQRDTYTNQPFKVWQLEQTRTGAVRNVRVIKEGVLDTHRFSSKERKISFIGASHITELAKKPDGLSNNALHKKRLKTGIYGEANRDTVDNIFVDASNSWEGVKFGQFNRLERTTYTKTKIFGNVIRNYQTEQVAGEVAAKTINASSTQVIQKVYGEALVQPALVYCFNPQSETQIFDAYRRDWEGQHDFHIKRQGEGGVGSTRFLTCVYAVALGDVSGVSIGFQNLNPRRVAKLKSYISPEAVDVLAEEETTFADNLRTSFIEDGGRGYLVSRDNRSFERTETYETTSVNAGEETTTTRTRTRTINVVEDNINVIIDVKTGKLNQVAFPQLTAISDGVYDATRRGIGIALVAITYVSSRENGEDLFSSFPSPYFIVRDNKARDIISSHTATISADESTRYGFDVLQVRKGENFIESRFFEDFAKSNILFSTAEASSIRTEVQAALNARGENADFHLYKPRQQEFGHLVRLRDDRWDITAVYEVVSIVNFGINVEVHLGRMVERSRSELFDDPTFAFEDLFLTFHNYTTEDEPTFSFGAETEHRWLKPSVVLADYLTSRVYGIGLDDSLIDLESFIASENAENVPSYLSGVVKDDENYQKLLSSLSFSAGLNVYESKGLVKLYATKSFELDDVAFTFTEDTIVNIKNDGVSKEHRINSVSLEYNQFVRNTLRDTSLSTEIINLLDEDALSNDNDNRIEKDFSLEFQTRFLRQVDDTNINEENHYGFLGELEQYGRMLIDKNRLQTNVEIVSNANVNLSVGDIFAVRYENYGWTGEHIAFFVATKIVYKKDFSVSVRGQQTSNSIFDKEDPFAAIEINTDEPIVQVFTGSIEFTDNRPDPTATIVPTEDDDDVGGGTTILVEEDASLEGRSVQLLIFVRRSFDGQGENPNRWQQIAVVDGYQPTQRIPINDYFLRDGAYDISVIQVVDGVAGQRIVIQGNVADSKVNEFKLNDEILNALCPIGTILDFAGNNLTRDLRDNWMICNGFHLLINDHPELFNVIGTTYGSGGSAGRRTFALPDFRGRVSAGVDDNLYNSYRDRLGIGSASRALGHTTGTDEMTLTEDHIPTHNHFVINTFTRQDRDHDGGRSQRNSSVTPTGDHQTLIHQLTGDAGVQFAEYRQYFSAQRATWGLTSDYGNGNSFPINQHTIIINKIIRAR